MAWYGNGGWDFRPYVSVAEKKANAARELARLTKKNGRQPEPIVLGHRKRQIATTFWGKAWCDNLEHYADFANRLPRGRSYVRNGSVVDLGITKGKVQARVAGTDLYTVEIGIAPMAKTRWRQVVTRCTGKIASWDCSVASCPPTSWPSCATRSRACFRRRARSRWPARVRTGPACASTWRRCSTVSAPGSIRSRTSSSCSGRSIRRSC